MNRVKKSILVLWPIASILQGIFSRVWTEQQKGNQLLMMQTMQVLWSNEDWGPTSGFTAQTVGNLVYASESKVTAGARVWE
jgi:hypothetical protein